MRGFDNAVQDCLDLIEGKVVTTDNGKIIKIDDTPKVESCDRMEELVND